MQYWVVGNLLNKILGGGEWCEPVAVCLVTSIFVLIQQYFLMSLGRLNPGMHTCKDSLRKVENKIPFEFWYGLWFLWPITRLSPFSHSFCSRSGSTNSFTRCLTLQIPQRWMYHSSSVKQDFIISCLEEGKLKQMVKLYAQAQLTLAVQKRKVSRYFRLMYFSSNGITLFPINYCSLYVVFLCMCTRNISGQSVISLSFLWDS